MRTELFVLLLLVAACSRLENLASDPDAGMRDASLDATLPDPEDGDVEPITFDGGVAYCGTGSGRRPCQCSDGINNDDDQLIDGFDPECTGPGDDSEANFGTGAREDTAGGFLDCFFDKNIGFDEGCRVPVSCSRAPDRPGNGNGASGCGVTEQCIDNCEPLVPNGCDCFGCCNVIVGARMVPVLLRSSCTMDAIFDTTKCIPCFPSSECNNPCEECEFCPGRTQLQARCAGSVDCADRTVCSKSSDCGANEYCLQGCCFATGF